MDLRYQLGWFIGSKSTLKKKGMILVPVINIFSYMRIIIERMTALNEGHAIFARK